MQYQPPVNGDTQDPDRQYVNPVPENGVEGSIPPAEAIEHPMREIEHAINYFLGTVETPLPADEADLQQLRKAISQAVIDGMVDALQRTVPATLGAGFHTTPVDLIVNAGVATFDPATGNRFKHVVDGALHISNPATIPDAGPAQIKLTIDGVGGHGITWGTKYRVKSAPVNDAGAVNRCMLEYDADDDVIDVVTIQRSEV
ncbi:MULTISPECIES: hypothetical protein [Thalassospira]|uniref:Uncharacterized protein n=1 Tax=Thalassospira profundimaris TaxID=502049 RepID=A0A367VA25_9PROT|nr:MULTISPECIES: hypothetical protein [Thalassospira]KZB73239.1 hypothetical protein AUQ43_18350 [Thalassospira sp. MCCC 1A01148]RCK21110.1 hypothetical protein TH6_15255 [Thalassospira profundimaris]